MASEWKTVFVTGGAGYIGSHCVVELLESGYDVVAIDNFANSVTEESGESSALKRVEKITGKKVNFYNCDLIDRDKLEEIFNKVNNLPNEDENFILFHKYLNTNCFLYFSPK